MGLTGRQRQGAGRAAILDHVFRLLARQGPDQLTLRAAAQAASCSLGTLTYHFANREDLLNAVYLERVLPALWFDPHHDRSGDAVMAFFDEIRDSLPLTEEKEILWQARLALINFATRQPKFRALVQRQQKETIAYFERRLAYLHSLKRLAGDKTPAKQARLLTLMIEGAALHILQAPATQKTEYAEALLDWLRDMTKA